MRVMEEFIYNVLRVEGAVVCVGVDKCIGVDVVRGMVYREGEEVGWVWEWDREGRGLGCVGCGGKGREEISWGWSGWR